MREIKFRAWDKENKIFHYFTLFDIWKNIKYPTHVVTNNEVYYIKDLPIGQYTGLKDKNGKEIWEGDIIEIDDDWKSGEGERGEVMWDEKNAMFRLFCYTKHGGEGWFMAENKTWMKLKIIGNIYENPELIEKK